MNNFRKMKYKEDNKNVDSIKKQKKRMPIWMLIATDIILTGIFLCIFALFHHVLPQHLSSEEIIVATIDESEANTFTLPSNDLESNSNNDEVTIDATSNNDAESNIDAASNIGAANNTDTSNNNDATSNSDATSNTDISNNDNSNESIDDSSDKGSDESKNSAETTDNSSKSSTSTKYRNYGNTNTSDIASTLSDSLSISSEEKFTTKVNDYSSDNIEMITNKVEVGSGSSKITYYISDIYVTNVKYIETAFATGEYGKNLRDSTLNMAEENNAILAVSGDFYGNSEIGVVIRNGVLYRSEVHDADICVLFTDGTMKTYSPEEFNSDEVLEQGAWQAWTFGPELLDGDGNILSSFNTTTYLNSTNPRSAIGYIEQGHYIFVVVDGRDEGYSKGVTLSELAQIMVEAGCMSAYNLDGGKSAAMVYEGEYVNQPSDGGRTISDIIYIKGE